MPDTEGECGVKVWVEVSVADLLYRQMFADLRLVHLVYCLQHCVRHCNVYDPAMEDMAPANV